MKTPNGFSHPKQIAEIQYEKGIQCMGDEDHVHSIKKPERISSVLYCNTMVPGRTIKNRSMIKVSAVTACTDKIIHTVPFMYLESFVECPK